ncbi:YccV-like-domain-containing protein [Eremomyces bilateralis CBS 781.70]|uniref:YccV-like-domain-containing protein n=1 Tax=Eremomyces bilateralis CBS 781.70 TaxID=1392243 RepID=A0A6G1G047_9PEZI|nr:YccV-like-domain-containing protein [Eremomyces bilateralis CBS 781.70]KAF1811189.1 YccV-like-domain-containing protein [Eremomyces bilateralis CBS 781.70]
MNPLSWSWRTLPPLSVAQNKPRCHLTDLPDELLDHILQFLRPKDVCAAQATCQRLHGVATSNLLWQRFCVEDFRFWKDVDLLREMLDQPPAANDWKEIYTSRMLLNAAILKRMALLQNNPTHKLQHLDWLLMLEFDAKDILLEQLHADPEVGDGMAVRYWSKVVLSAIHKQKSVKIWGDLHNGRDIELESALAGLDLCALGSLSMTAEIGPELDDLAERFRQYTPEHGRLSTRETAVALAAFLRDQGFQGVPEADYHELRNRFIGIALRHPHHRALPLVNAAIYCGVARRLGITAHPTDFPLHIMVIVQASESKTLDGRPLTDEATDDQKRMFMDPFRDSREHSVEELRGLLSAMEVHPDSWPDFMTPASTIDLVLRNARNILNGLHRHRHYDFPQNIDPWGATGEAEHPTDEDLLYSSVWAQLMLSQQPQDVRRLADFYAVRLQDERKYDVPLIEKYLLTEDGPHTQSTLTLSTVCTRTRLDDMRSVTVKRRNTAEVGRVKYRVGQMMKHARYGYTGLVVGWDSKCEQSEEWIRTMNVDALGGGRSQAFYLVRASDGHTKYVAEESIKVYMGEPSDRTMRGAGEFFQRFDQQTREFISNIRDEYPDD